MTYQRKLAHPDWQRKRLEILQRDDFKCTNCGSKEKELHVHHKYYIPGKLPHDYPNESLISLCYECHEFEENYFKDAQETFISRLRIAGFDGFCINYLIESAERAAKNGIDPYWVSEMVNFYRMGTDEERSEIHLRLWEICDNATERFKKSKEGNGEAS